ncbi:hypothetical protein EGY07_16955 [Chryseobacterium indologenes]|uniref:hypothetical protein n=1 Tax=Chryseobacterium indologenes TaxID=253 RepID=UPI000F4E68B4|nr:hypothetical protein [Chryseobacterium indologenes]AYZ37112.1 hypothetical protein EGY07_16955 [Chryseobacterium indologenes]MBF6645959.1 hypothetical protein [Chryseobacterium indologenes]MBU3048274.1 hypothetical protein [Chryseobacterium indologenes]MEB4761006.1 hypothetical protein [Chryseobacterium indologenes]QQQ70380.1 hypothetical protein JHW31_18040 [Chryseobacterium indologenes]
MELKAYFQSYENYFWEWKTDEDVPGDSGYHNNNLLSVPGVGAIAYRPYVMEILKELQPQGWPPFGALLMVLYAMQDGYIDFEKPLRKTVNFYSVGDVDFKAEKQIEFLKKVQSLPKIYKQKQNKIVLLQTLFKNGHNRTSSVVAAFNLQIYSKRPHEIETCAEKKHARPSYLNRDLSALDLNTKFPDVQSIIDAMKDLIGEPELDDEVIQEEATANTDKDFIRELTEDPKTFQVGSLIKRIWSGLKIPMRHLSPGEQPVGGISDMTNKGDFHRMLLSEFANDEEVFMNRVANNEVLYIQREIPPEENIFERIILIDTSLRNWGTPKVLAFASALAVIKHPKAHSECKVFALGQSGIPISLDKVEDVIENLNQVSSVLQVSEALGKFFTEQHTEKDIEVFFITHQENMADEKVQKIIHENRDRLKFLVTTTADGEINFYKHHLGTRKHIQKIKLPLQELWANPPQQKQKNDHRNGKKTDLPQNYPILFPAPVNTIARFLYEGEFYILSSKKQLLKTYLSDNYYNRHSYDYYKTFHGCEVLFENISVKPRGQFAMAKNKQQHFILCQYQYDKKLVSKLNLNTREYSEQNLTGLHIPESYHLIYFGKSFYLHEPSNDTVYRINIDGKISVEVISTKDREIEKNNIKAQAEVAKLNRSGLKIISNFNGIGITNSGDLVVSGNKLYSASENTLDFSKNRGEITIFAEQNKNKFTFPDGSEIITDSRGMLTFRSSNKGIEEFFIPSTLNGYLALATYTEFGGSEYYLPEQALLKVKTMDEMCQRFLKAFIEQILDYGA